MTGYLEINLTHLFGMRSVRRIKNNAPHQSFQFLLGRKPITIENLFFDLSMVSANGAKVTGNHGDCGSSDTWIVNQDDISQEIQEHRLDALKELGDDESLELIPDRLPWGFIANQWLHRRPVYTKILVRQHP